MPGSWEPFFLPSLCLNVHFSELYTDASTVLSVCKCRIKYSTVIATWERKKGSETCSCNSPVTQKWLCSHGKSDTVKVQRSHLSQWTAGEKATTQTRESIKTVLALAAPTSAERYQNESMSRGGELGSGLWRSVYLCRMASQIVVCIATWKT